LSMHGNDYEIEMYEWDLKYEKIMRMIDEIIMISMDKTLFWKYYWNFQTGK